MVPSTPFNDPGRTSPVPVPFKSSEEVYTWISRFINLESKPNQKAYKLDRMKILAELADHPEKCAPIFHIAGSKGKGSVTGMIASILEASGIKTARYISPHISNFRERISMGQEFLSEDIYTRAGNELRKIIEFIPSSPKAKLFDTTLNEGEEPTFFELMTLWFFLCARLSSCGAMAVETGLGGRLDATNILTPLVSVITLIELEHTEYLGNTIPAIAGEKAGIIKPGKPLVLSEQTLPALEVFKERAALNNSPLLYFPGCAKVHNVQVNREGTRFDLMLKIEKTTTIQNLFIPIPGEVQAKNAGLAVLAVLTAFPHISNEQIKKGLTGFTLPARFEHISDKPHFIIDGAHTKQSITMCLNTFSALYGRNGILVFGCAEGKDVLSMAELCVPLFSSIIITTPGTFKKSSPEHIYEVFEEEIKKTNNTPALFFIPNTDEAITTAINLSLEHDLPILGTGSFYLSGEIRKRINP